MHIFDKTFEVITREMIEEIIETNQLNLSATQTKICLPIVNRIYRKMRAGLLFPGIQVLENKIINGHHRYIASHFCDFQLQYDGAGASNIPVIEWESVLFEEEDWDSDAGIRVKNEEDARFNNRPIEEIEQLLQD